MWNRFLSLLTNRTDPNSWHNKEKRFILNYKKSELLALPQTTFSFRGKLNKHIFENGHPYADIFLENDDRLAALNVLAYLNHVINNTNLPKSFRRDNIPLNNIVFATPGFQEATRIIITPTSHNGYECPYNLFFKCKEMSSSSLHGSVFFDSTGKPHQADIFFWIGKIGRFYYFDTHEGIFELSKITYPDGECIQHYLYKCEYLVCLEQRRNQEESDFLWLAEHLPDKCPKSITGYRRMKTMHSKNFMSLKQQAAELGYTLLDD